MPNKLRSFSDKVRAVVRKIPRGKTLTYKQVATRVGIPSAAQAVGNVMKRNHDPRVPCHRVIRSDGSLGGYNRGAKLKQKLLQEEGYLPSS